MADKTEEGSWFGSWLSAAKNKSTEVLEFVRKDLEEFGSVVKTEATSVVASAGSVMEKTLSLDSPDSTASTVKRSFSTFLGQVNTVLNPSPDDEDTEAMLITENSEAVKLNKFQQSLFELQKNPETYLCDPEPQFRKQFECWLEISDDQLTDDRVAKHVNSSELLKKHYNKLVPDIVEHQIFWKRYLFKKALLEDEIAKQELVEKKEQKEKEQLEKTTTEMTTFDPFKAPEEKNGWEQEDFAQELELSEEQQIKLLEEYENETKQKKSSTSNKNKSEKNKQTNKKEKSSGALKKTEPSSKSVNKTESAENLESPVSSSSSTTDDDWEKVTDVEK